MLTDTQSIVNTESKFQVSQMTGISEDRIGTVRLQLEKLLSEGILIDLVIGGESMFQKSADWAEIGIQVGELQTRRMTRGSKYLINTNRIKNLRSATTRMRQWLDRLTNDITGFRPWRYLNYKRYPEWVEKWNELAFGFTAVKTDILEHYESDVQDLVQDFTDIADRNWRSLTAIGYTSIFCGGAEYTDREEFIHAIVNQVLSRVPTKEIIQAELQADYRVSVLQGREQVQKDIAQEAVVKAGFEAKQREAYLGAELLQEQFRHDSTMNRLVEQEKEVAIDAMMRAEADHIREQFKETVSPIEEIFTQVRNQMAEVCIEAAESVQKNGHLRGKTAEKLKGLVEFYHLTSIQDDPQLLQRLVELKQTIGAVGDDRPRNTPERSPAEVISALQGVIELQNSIKSDLDAGPTRASMIF